MPTHAEPVACCGPLAVEPLNSWDWYGRGHAAARAEQDGGRPPEFGEQTDNVLASWVYRGRDRRRSRTKLCECLTVIQSLLILKFKAFGRNYGRKALEISRTPTFDGQFGFIRGGASATNSVMRWRAKNEPPSNLNADQPLSYRIFNARAAGGSNFCGLPGEGGAV
jgi:hypothetical protein